MKFVEDKIRECGKVVKGDILKVDSFLNHQIDIATLNEIVKEFKNRFADCEINKILTIESSGIALAALASQFFNFCPIVFAKKYAAKNMDVERYSEKLYSYTRQKTFEASVAKEYLSENDKVLILDDFLANGEALNALLSICRQAKARVVGCGVVVEKAYQGGGDTIRGLGVRVEALARVKSMNEEGEIEFYPD